jgi:NAD(P)H-flavin reductase
MQTIVALMGEITFIANGFATTIHDDGSKTTTPLVFCDVCQEMCESLGGRDVMMLGEKVMWQCSKCRK